MPHKSEMICVMFIHGVPTNADQYTTLMKLMCPFADVTAVDLLGMGESSMPLDYDWSWKDDADYYARFIEDIILVNANAWGPTKKNKLTRVHIVADDWGGGPAQKLASEYPHLIASLTLIDPIALDGYPVAEIQAIGRASQLPFELDRSPLEDPFKQAMGAFDQTLIQILKTMISAANDANKQFGQYYWRKYKNTYYKTNYHDVGLLETEDMIYVAEEDAASSLTLGPKWRAIRVLSQRSAILAPFRLLPYHPKKNPKGVKFSRITMPVCIMWGEHDNMMPRMQQHRLCRAMGNAKFCWPISVPRAGHFAGMDQPKFVATYLIEFLSNVLRCPKTKGSLGSLFLGLDGIGKGDESFVIANLS